MLKSKPKNSIKIGQLFALGKHHLLAGDATNSEHVKLLMKSKKVDLICVDIPYGVGYVENKRTYKQKLGKEKIIVNDNISSETEYAKFNKEWLGCIKPYMASKNSAYIFNSDKMLFALRDGLQQAGWYMSQLLIWVKNSSIVGRLDYLPQHELIIYAWHGTHKFKKAKDKSVLIYPRPSKSKLHPTMKPVSLLRRLILNSTNIGDVVYDGFLGSGSCLIACEQIGRICYGIEIDTEYCQTIIDRYEKITGNKAKLLT
jgi:DNA modification methylase